MPLGRVRTAPTVLVDGGSQSRALGVEVGKRDYMGVY